MKLLKTKIAGNGKKKVYFLGIQVFVSAQREQVIMEVCEHIDDCKKVLSWLCDEESRDVYFRDLASLALARTEYWSKISQYLTTFSEEKWNIACAELQNLHAKNALPAINTSLPKGTDDYLFLTTFIVEQYTYKDLVTIQKGDVVLDCGGCFGETAVWALQKGATKVYVFEPSPPAIPYIKANAKEFGEQGQMILVPYALGNETGSVSFKIEPGLAGSYVQKTETYFDGSVSVSQIKLDDWCEENSVVPDFIKMDIEGAEVDAIKGASQTIAKYKPRLAICLYHRTSDMWVIPALLKTICPEYRFWCKPNSPFREFVLYASI